MAEGGPNPPDLETQKNEINVLIKKPLKKRDTWYLIDNRWFKLWKKYVGYDSWDTVNVGEQSSHPGPIDNGPLFKDAESGELKEHLIDELDYVLVPVEAWEKLVSWYSYVDGQEAIARKVVEHGMFVKNCKVEVYLVEFKLCQNSDLDNWVSQKFSKADTIDHIEKEMRKLFNIAQDKETRLWNKYMSNTYEQLNKKDSTVQDAGLYQSQVLVIEQINDDGTWPRHVKSTNNSVSYSSSPSSSSPEGKNGGATSKTTRNYASFNYPSNYNSYDYNSGAVGNVQPGLCGLSNLGNTCFMNSALQCMSNTPPLTRYFLEDRYLEELNLDNPLGMKGEIAKSYAELIKQMWSGRYSYTVPRNFKTQVGRFAPQFSGYQQQDSQELMAFLLDGLHEDLNRIKKKPYIELKDADGRPDPEVAREAWENYRKRNDSIIVDIFHGLLKSTLVCPECDKISVTFDPFCYLSLPLPIKKERQMDIFLVYSDPMVKPVKFKVTVPKMGIVSDLCVSLSRFSNIPPEKMLVTDVYNHRFHKVFPTDEILNHILDKDDIFVYEVPFSTPDDPEFVIIPVYLREEKPPSQYNYSRPPQLFGQPLLIPIPRKNCTYDILYDLLLQKMARFVRIPDDNNEWWVDPVEMEKVNGEIDINNENDSEEDSQKDDVENAVLHEDVKDPENEEQIEEDNRKHHLFTIHFVNSCGNSELDGLKDDGKPIKFSNRMYIAIDWKMSAKNNFYDEKAADEYEQHESTCHKHTQKKQVIQLDECLQLFTTTEKLGAEDPWFCPSCSKHQQATKKFDLWMLPKILVIHLKRFSYNRYWRDKIDTLVEFPTRNLNMGKYIINASHGPAMYDLVAVSNHYGGMGGGHYTAYGANKDDEQWYYFDDSSVSPSSEDVVISKAAYVLFYMLRDAQGSLNTMRPRNTLIPAAAGAPMNCHDSGINSSDEDDSMDTN